MSEDHDPWFLEKMILNEKIKREELFHYSRKERKVDVPNSEIKPETKRNLFKIGRRRGG